MSYDAICPMCIDEDADKARHNTGHGKGWIDIKLCPGCEKRPRKRSEMYNHLSAIKDSGWPEHKSHKSNYFARKKERAH